MSWTMPNPVLIGSKYYLRVHVPRDVSDAVKGTAVVVPVGDGYRTIRVGAAVKVSLETTDRAEARRRFAVALAALEQHWDALRKGPVTLSHKQCVALAGEVRAVWVEVLDEEPGPPELWQRVQEADRLAREPQPSPFAQLMIGNQSEPCTSAQLESRFGGMVDAILRRHGLVVDTRSRERLLEQVSTAMDDAVRVNLQKAKGDYSDDGVSTNYPRFLPPVSTPQAKEDNGGAKTGATFDDAIDDEVRRRAAGRDAKPLPERTTKKFRMAVAEFAAFRQSKQIGTVTAREAEDWKLAMQDDGKLSNNTIAQRIQNVATVIDWARRQSLGELFPSANPLAIVERPKGAPRDSSERTLRMNEARLILREARKAKRPELRWLPWMMAYSGARVEELAQLTPEDFFCFEDDWFYRVTTRGQKTVKNAYGIRRVPVHPILIQEGLIDYVEQQRAKPKERLFPERSQGNLRDWVRREIGLTREELAPNHGWRHLFEDKALIMNTAVKHYITGRTTGHSSEGYGKSDAMLPTLAAQMSLFPSYL